MTKSLTKKTFIFVTTLTVLLNTNTAFAAVTCDPNTGEDAISPLAIMCPIANVLEFAYQAGLAIFLIMIIVTSFKFATAQGDPKAMEGARNSLTYTIVGFVVILLLFSVSKIIGNLFGFDDGSILFSPLSGLTDGIADILNFAGVTY